MSRRPAPVTQAQVKRVVRGALQAGAKAVEVRPDGTIIVHADEQHVPATPPAALEWPEGAVL